MLNKELHHLEIVVNACLKNTNFLQVSITYCQQLYDHITTLTLKCQLSCLGKLTTLTCRLFCVAHNLVRSSLLYRFAYIHLL